MGKTLDGRSPSDGFRIAIAVSRFNSRITQKLLKGALTSLKDLRVADEDIDIVWVPGAFELPQTVRALAATRKYDGILPLGCVIRGETQHFEYICQSVTSGLTQLALESETPIVFGVLTTHTVQQAASRAGAKVNKGSEAASSLIELIHVIRALRK